MTELFDLVDATHRCASLIFMFRVSKLFVLLSIQTSRSSMRLSTNQRLELEAWISLVMTAISRLVESDHCFIL